MARLIIYEGSDEEIRKYLASLPPPLPEGTNLSGIATNGNGQSHWDNIAEAFRKRLHETAAGGRTGQLKALTAWLQKDGSIELTQLWKASGVKTQHDYGGIGSSLTKNMKRAGGMKNWYSWEPHPTKTGEWIYTIVPELVKPLRKAFGV
jgi:hypothetical protein